MSLDQGAFAGQVDANRDACVTLAGPAEILNILGALATFREDTKRTILGNPLSDRLSGDEGDRSDRRETRSPRHIFYYGTLLECHAVLAVCLQTAVGRLSAWPGSQKSETTEVRIHLSPDLKKMELSPTST